MDISWLKIDANGCDRQYIRFLKGQGQKVKGQCRQVAILTAALNMRQVQR